ncbi:MAG: dihydrofolate reductase [Proteobacteria bacterium]|nr:dihydrofolate reductase [Desulfobulbaceae bacterium]MBU4152065.1 dihydrofolate reductase [Pseudomonadota bacterium]
MAANRVIGQHGTIPWHLPGEQLRFRDTTWGWPLIMGRKTYDSIGRALPGRRNIIITRQVGYHVAGCETANSLDEALDLCRDTVKVFVIGGEQIFVQALPLTDTVILTTISREVEGDTVFPTFEQDFTVVSREVAVDPESYTIEVYRRKGEDVPRAEPKGTVFLEPDWKSSLKVS